MLIPVSDPKANASEALRHAASCGHREIVEMLIPTSYPKANDSDALMGAASCGHKEIVELLLPFSDPKANDSKLLRSAAFNGHEAVVELLIPVSDVDAACKRLDESGKSLLKAMEADFRMKELQASTVQIPQSFNQCVDQARSSSREKMATQRAQARRL
jgi:hypothetical protein